MMCNMRSIMSPYQVMRFILICENNFFWKSFNKNSFENRTELASRTENRWYVRVDLHVGSDM